MSGRSYRRTTAFMLAAAVAATACGQTPRETAVDVPQLAVPADYAGDAPNPSMRSWTAPSTTLLVDSQTTSTEPPAPPSDPGELLWIGTYLGHTDGSKDVTFILAADGSVLRVDDRSIYGGSGSYLTWNIGPVGFQAVLDLMVDLDVQYGDEIGVDSNETQVGTIRSAFGPNADIRGLNLSPSELTTEQATVRRNFIELLRSLEDMSWLDDVTTVTQKTPWVPDRLSLKVTDEVNPQYYSTAPYQWPFDDSVTDMTSFDPSEAGGPSFVCLEGADAEKAWTALVVDGVNNARIPIESADRRYEVGAFISFPMYQLHSDPCPGAEQFGTGETNTRVDRPDLSGLLLDQADIGVEWKVGPASVASPPPYIRPCDPITEAEVAVLAFDSWLTHRVDFTGIEHLVDGFQLIGTAPEGQDAAAVVEAIATYDCLGGLREYGITEVESGLLPDAPEGVIAAYWILRYSDDFQGVVIDVALDNGIVLAIGLNSILPVQPSHLEEWLALAVSKASDG